MTFVWIAKAGSEELASHSKRLILSIENGYSAQAVIALAKHRG
jgi:hypothetical protein